MNYLLLNRSKKQETKIKLGFLPTSAIVDNFDDAHVKDSN